MPRFRCTSCGRRIESAVVIGAGDCPHCGGDVIFDIHADPPPERPPRRSPLVRALLKRLTGR
jgi:DNA-directed RNA polymerase subunit RPC12/RpoP